MMSYVPSRKCMIKERTDPDYKNEYVDIEDAQELKDPVLADAVSLIPQETWARSKDIFGGPIMVPPRYAQGCCG